MAWNWTFKNWPQLVYDPAALAPLEQAFMSASGEVVGAVRHVGTDDQNALRLELLSDEAITTSAIEGEVLDRDSVQSSLRRQFGLRSDDKRAHPRERGIAELLADLYGHYAEPLDHQTLHTWHRMLMADNASLETIGAYRTHADAMQIVSGRFDKPEIHFEAPPSHAVPREMDAYIAWFNQSAPNGAAPLSPLIRAGLGHIYFESIHPFEDGNGRLGRALAEKSLAQNLGRPSLIALSFTIEKNRKAYYEQLARHQTQLEVTEWLVWFGQTVLDAQRITLDRVSFYIAKAKFYDRHRGALNERQTKVVDRMFRQGPEGFQGGLSAENYIAITKTSRATATRDLADLVHKAAFTRTGTLRHTRYELNL